jgi:predicted GH43/DUF377 family glycosyl hydrolase
MKWRKLGLIFKLPRDIERAASHAMHPIPLLLDDEVLRLYYSPRDELGRSHPFFVDVDARDPSRIIRYSKKPAMELGGPGCFDDNGAVPCTVLKLPDGRYYMYYVGFELFQQVRYKLFIGLAISNDGADFVRLSNVPVLDRSDKEFCFRCSPCVRLTEQGFEMYYSAGSDWTVLDGKTYPVYIIKHIVSPDGIHWPDEGRVVLPISGPDEHGFGTPWVLPLGDGYEMYYSVRRISNRGYRLGWGTSADGLNWNRRDDELGLDISPGSFDGREIMYGAVITLHGHTYCFYNGNDFGVDGFAAAVREE